MEGDRLPQPVSVNVRRESCERITLHEREDLSAPPPSEASASTGPSQRAQERPHPPQVAAQPGQREWARRQRGTACWQPGVWMRGSNSQIRADQSPQTILADSVAGAPLIGPRSAWTARPGSVPDKPGARTGRSARRTVVASRRGSSTATGRPLAPHDGSVIATTSQGGPPVSCRRCRTAPQDTAAARSPSSACRPDFEFRRGHAVALRAEADKATASPPKRHAKAEACGLHPGGAPTFVRPIVRRPDTFSILQPPIGESAGCQVGSGGGVRSREHREDRPPRSAKDVMTVLLKQGDTP